MHAYTEGVRPEKLKDQPGYFMTLMVAGGLGIRLFKTRAGSGYFAAAHSQALRG
jgi:hypothetical protein